MLECEVQICLLPHYKELPPPRYMTEGASGFDLLAAVQNSVEISAHERTLIPCGFQVAIPKGFEGQVRPRSGLALKEGLGILNSPGTIDSDFRGEVQVILYNASPNPFVVKRGMRIGQLVIAPVIKAHLVVVDNLQATSRGYGGFGHTGLHA